MMQYDKSVCKILPPPNQKHIPTTVCNLLVMNVTSFSWTVNHFLAFYLPQREDTSTTSQLLLALTINSPSGLTLSPTLSQDNTCDVILSLIFGGLFVTVNKYSVWGKKMKLALVTFLLVFLVLGSSLFEVSTAGSGIYMKNDQILGFIYLVWCMLIGDLICGFILWQVSVNPSVS